jgi:hypothetical protein
VVVFPGRNFPSHRRKKERKKYQSQVDWNMFLTYHIFPKNKEEEDIVQDGSLALCRDH